MRNGAVAPTYLVMRAVTVRRAQAAVRSCAELKETLLHKHEAHTALRTELKRAQVRRRTASEPRGSPRCAAPAAACDVATC